MLRRTETAAGEDIADRGFAKLCQQPFVLRRPPNQTVPFVFSSPHSGRLYPATFINSSRLGEINLRRSEDAFVDEIFASALDIGAPLIAACFPRVLVDANRAPTELDPSMFDGELALPVDAASTRVNAGLGVIPRVVRQGLEIYHGKVSAEVAEGRLTQFHRPYHAALSQLLSETRRIFGTVYLIDCHSMPSGVAGPDIVLGDRHGLSAAPFVTLAAQRALETQGLRVARNSPYAGGYTTQLYGHPARGMHALQIEINRALYLDEETIVPGAAFLDVCGRIAAALASLVDLCSQSEGPFCCFAHAAE
jgi:N-formylglutamate amidohydrolase